MIRITIASLSLVTWLGLTSAAAAQRTTSPPDNRLYQSIADDIFLQEINQKIPTDQPVTAIGVHRGTVYAVMGGRLHALRDDAFAPVEESSEVVQRLFKLGDVLWGSTDKGVYRGGEKVFDQPMVDMCMHQGAIHGATSSDVYRFENGAFVNIKPDTGWLTTNTTMIMADGTQVLADPITLGPIDRIASYNETIYLLARGRIGLLDGPVFNLDSIDWGTLPSASQRDMRAHGSRLYIATNRGLGVLRGAALTSIQGENGLPYEDTTCLAHGFADDLWIGTAAGAIRKVGDQYHYFGAQHWLPGDHVHDIAVDGKTVYIATDKGVGVIRYEPYTLLKKSAYFERNLEQMGHKRLGFVHKLYWSGQDNGWLREISDNDGGHTAHYLAAMSFKYAVTQDEATRREAVDAFEAMRWLQTITGTDGFFARAIWAVDADQGRRSTRGSGGLPAKWYATDDGLWQWKGDTSSDEVNSHFYAVALFHDLAARGDEKNNAADHLARIARHILDNGWILRDMDGKPTRWGRWDPDYLLQPYGFEARGLNGMEAQTYMWTALALTGDARYQQGLDQLLEWRYHTYTVREKLTFPPESVVPWDDELAFRCFHPLLTYCDDPDLRSIYVRAMQRHWEVLRMQKVPFYNFIYGALTGNDCEAAQGVRHLRDWSLDTVIHSFRNSHRADLAVEPGYTPYMGGTRGLSPRELASSWGSRSAIHYDGGGSGRGVYPPVGWLEDYWMGRYYGMIQAPTTTDASLLSVTAPTDGQPKGAKPYDGPPRP